MFSRRWGVLLAACLFIIFLVGSKGTSTVPAKAQSTKLVSLPAFGEVMDFQISPDNQVVVYRADQDVDEVSELYSLHLPNGTPIKLNASLPPDKWVSNFLFSPDSRSVVYETRGGTDGDYELYSVPVSGPSSAAIKLSSSPPDGAIRIIDYQVSPDGAYVVYVADQEKNNDYELFRVPLQGPAGSVIKLSSGQAEDFKISPDSQWVVYTGEALEYQDKLYSVPLDGDSGDATLINHPLRETLFVCVPDDFETRDSVIVYAISPDSGRVVYSASTVVEGAPGECFDEMQELYSVPVSGPQDQAAKIQSAPGFFYDAGEFTISSDSNWVVYKMKYGLIDELYSVPVLGPPGAAVRLNPVPVPDGEVDDYRISPDSSRVVYVGDLETSSRSELYSVPIDGPSTSSIKISQPMSGEAEVDYRGFEVTPDSSKVVFLAGEAYVDWNVFSVPITGPSSQVVQISGPMTPGGFVYDFLKRFEISPGGARVIYKANQDTLGVSELFIAPVDGPLGSSTKINGPMQPGGNVYASSFCPNSNCVLYTADQDTEEVVELYGYFEAGSFKQEVYLPLVVR